MVGDIYKNNFQSEKTALIFKGSSISYGQLDQAVMKYAGYLKKYGIQPGDKVVLSCINSPEFIYSYMGTTRNGAVIVPINLMLTMEEITYIVKNSEAKLIKNTQDILEDYGYQIGTQSKQIHFENQINGGKPYEGTYRFRPWPDHY